MKQELYHFFGRTDETPSKAAFYHQRAKLKDNALRELLQIFNQKLQPTLYRNRYRLVACDGSVADEVDPELLAKVLANPEMRALLNSLAKTDHTLANKIEAPHEILRKNPVQYMNMSRIFLFTTIFFTIFPSIIRKIFHCNDYSYPPSP